MAVLKTPGLGLEGFEFRDAEAPKAGYASGIEAVFLESRVKERRHVAPANERAVDSHKIDISDVVHELEELNLTMGRALDGTASRPARRPPNLLKAIKKVLNSYYKAIKKLFKS